MSGERRPNIDRKFPKPAGRGPNGRRLCRVCAAECAPRCSSYCGDKCREASLIYYSWELMRRHVFERDGGRCADCALDVGKLDRVLSHAHLASLRSIRREHGFAEYGLYRHAASLKYRWDAEQWVRAELGFSAHGHLWEIDHVTPVESGGLCEPDNLKLRCVPCHKKKSAAQARAKKFARAQARWADQNKLFEQQNARGTHEPGAG